MPNRFTYVCLKLKKPESFLKTLNYANEYLGKSHAFDTAIAAFATAYADQSERDHAILENAVRSGHLEAVME